MASKSALEQTTRCSIEAADLFPPPHAMLDAFARNASDVAHKVPTLEERSAHVRRPDELPHLVLAARQPNELLPELRRLTVQKNLDTW